MGKKVSGWGACVVPPEATGLQKGIPASQDPFPLPISTPVGPWTLPLEEKLGEVSRCEPLPPLIQCPVQVALCSPRSSDGAGMSEALHPLLPGPLTIREATVTQCWSVGAARGGDRAREQRAGGGLPLGRAGMCAVVWLTWSPSERVT